MFEISGTLKRLLGYHYDRRERLYSFLSTLKPNQLTDDLRIGHGSIWITLLHCLECEVHWLRHVVQGAPFRGIDETNYPDINSVRQLAQEVRAGTEHFLANTTAEDWSRTYEKTYRDGTKLSLSLEDALLQVITHDTHHRGQILVLARQMGYTPPDLDFL